jgi:hypothetical protein
MKLPKNLSEEYKKKFFVGLLEGDGTITCHLNRSNLRIAIVVRTIIALKRAPDNIEMLESVQSIIGGRVNLTIQKDKDGNIKEYVVWEAKSKTDVKNVFDLFIKYPLITANK